MKKLLKLPSRICSCCPAGAALYLQLPGCTRSYLDFAVILRPGLHDDGLRAYFTSSCTHLFGHKGISTSERERENFTSMRGNCPVATAQKSKIIGLEMAKKAVVRERMHVA